MNIGLAGVLDVSKSQQDQQQQQIQSRRNDAMDYATFRRMMRTTRNLAIEIVKCTDNGACLFNSISMGMCGNEEMNQELRRNAVENMDQNRDLLIGLEQDDLYVRKNFRNVKEYLDYMKLDTSFGDQYETTAVTRVYNRPIFVYNLRGDGK